MPRPPLATWKYAYGARLPRRGRAPTALIAVLTTAVVVLLLWTVVLMAADSPSPTRSGPPGPVPALTVAVVVLAVVSARGLPRGSRIGMSRRYLVCGGEIVYFANVISATMDRHHGVLRLVCADQRVFELRRQGFTTNARKPHKIEQNLQAKFGRVSGRILTRVRDTSPDAQITYLESAGT